MPLLLEPHSLILSTSFYRARLKSFEYLKRIIRVMDSSSIIFTVHDCLTPGVECDEFQLWRISLLTENEKQRSARLWLNTSQRPAPMPMPNQSSEARPAAPVVSETL